VANPYEIPTEMKDFAERSVAQARKAFEGFMGAVHKTHGSADDAAANATASVKDVTDKALGYAEKNVSAAFDLAEQLLKAKDPKEVLTLQGEYLKNQMAALQEQTRELGETFQKATGLKK
jgi:phasin